MNSKYMTLIFALALAGSSWATLNDAYASAGHGEESGEGHADERGHEAEEGTTTISPEAAKAAGIVAEAAGPVTMGERLALRGKIILSPESSADVKARFPGVVKSVKKAIGQTVAKGETLATVESNDSLQTYAVTSPLAGVVLNRNINVGDTAAEQPMFTIANLNKVTAHLHVFPQDLAKVNVGQQVQVQSVDGGLESEGKITALMPVADADTQTVQAWVELPNPEGRWRSGMAVQAFARLGNDSVPLAVKNTAIQMLENQPVVFVQKGNAYTAHPVKLGRTDGFYTEVLEGLEPGSLYVSKNSFTVKADIGKSGAGHEH